MKTVRLDGVVGWDILAEDVARQIKGEGDVKVIINSGGGDVTEGFAIYNLLNDHEGSITVNVDFAASMGSVIAMAGDSISMKANSSLMMIHRPWGMTSGNSEELRSHADTLDKMEGMLLGIYMEKATVSEADLSNMLAEETYLNAKEAQDIGLIDSVEGGKSDLAMVAMAGMKAKEHVNFSVDKFVAKINSIKGGKSPVRDAFEASTCLADVEAVMRQDFNLSRSEATAIVAAVKKITHGDREKQEKEVLNSIQNFQFNF